MGFHGAWAMAIGGMIGGGIFSALGLVVATAGAFSWVSFLVAGATAGLVAYCYAALAAKFREGGGAFLFLRKEGMPNFAGALSWVLIAGYVLTISVYAFAFAAYMGHVFGASVWITRWISLLIVAGLVALNIVGVRSSALFEKVSVWGKLSLLLLLAVVGLLRFDPSMISLEGAQPDFWELLFMVPLGAAVGFMAYEGFQLLSYDYDDIDDPDETIRRSTWVAVVVTTILYILVFLGAASLIGSQTIVSQKEVAMAEAGRAAGEGIAYGPFLGFALMTLAALFSTGSAINATLFATARLARKVAQDKELPALAARTTKKGIPHWSLVGIGVFSAALAMLSGLRRLVEAASLAFLITFLVVALIAWYEKIPHRWVAALSVVLAAGMGGLLGWRLVTQSPITLAAFAAMLLLATVGRYFFLQRSKRRRTGGRTRGRGS